MYSTHNERKSVAAERFIRTLKNKIYRHMRTVSKNVYIDKLDDIISEYKIILILTLLKKSVTRTLNLKLLIMLEYQNTKTFLLKDMLQIGLKKILSLKKLKKKTVPWACVINDLNDEEVIGTFYEKLLQKTNQQTF